MLLRMWRTMMLLNYITFLTYWMKLFNRRQWILNTPNSVCDVFVIGDSMKMWLFELIRLYVRHEVNSETLSNFEWGVNYSTRVCIQFYLIFSRDLLQLYLCRWLSNVILVSLRARGCHTWRSEGAISFGRHWKR